MTAATKAPAHIVRLKNRPDADKTEPFLDINRIVYGIAFHPDYTKNHYLYVGSNGPDGSKDKKDRVSRFTVEAKPPYRCDPKSELVILEWESDGHNGGDVAFGPDGFLYVTSGDGTSDSDVNLRGQDLTHLTAKVMRIDVDHPAEGKAYSVPKDNPFVDRKNVCPETWAYGLRNPWRMTFDRKTGRLWVGQNGQDLWEQAYVIHKGDNCGWSVNEGSHPFQPDRARGPDPIAMPAVEHHHSVFRSLTGGVVYYGKKYPDLDGAYIYGDYSTGAIWAARNDGEKTLSDVPLADSRLQIVGFGIDPDGEVLIVDHAGGLYTLEPTPKEQPKPPFPTKLSETGLFTSVKGHQVDPGLIPYDVNAPLWSDGASKERFIALPGDGKIEFADARGWNFPEGAVLVKTFSLDMAKASLRRDAVLKRGCSRSKTDNGKAIRTCGTTRRPTPIWSRRRGWTAFMRSAIRKAGRRSQANLALSQPGRVHGLPQPGGQLGSWTHHNADEQSPRLRRRQGRAVAHAGTSRRFHRQTGQAAEGVSSAHRSRGNEGGLEFAGTFLSASQLRPVPRPRRRRQLADGFGIHHHERRSAPNRRQAPAPDVRHRQIRY